MAGAEDKEKKEIGRLVVVVLKAKSLPDKHTFSKQDPYAVIELSNSSTETTKEERNGGQHPVWDEQFVMTVYDVEGEEQKLTIKVFAKEPGPHPLLGTGEVSIVPRKAEQWENNEFDDWVPLGQDGKYRGEVFIEMTWYPRQDLLPKAKPRPAGAKVPAPSKSLPRPSLAALAPQELEESKQANPVAWGLKRRQSKLDPKTRLGRPTIVLGPTDEELGPSSPPPRGSSLQPWPDQTINQQPRPNPKLSASALPLPGEPEPLPIPAWLQPALGQAAALPQARPHPPAQTQPATLQDDVRFQQQAPRIETTQWRAQQPAPQQQQPTYGRLQPSPAPSPHLPGAYSYAERPVSPSGYGSAAQPHYTPVTNVYGAVPYPPAPVPTPAYDPNPHRFTPAPAPQFPHRQSTPYVPQPAPARPPSVYDSSFVPRPAPAPPVAPSPPVASHPPVRASPPPAPAPPLSSRRSHNYRDRSPPRRSPSPPRLSPSPPPPRHQRVRTPSPPQRERSPPPARKPLPKPAIDERQASIYAQLQRQREQEDKDARMAAAMAAEFDGQEERAESQRREMDQLSQRTARIMADSHKKSWEDERREREEADAKMARDLALAEELE